MSRTKKPVNQKSVYNSFAMMYEKIMNDEITVDKAEQAINALNGMNRTFALELKRADVSGEVARNIEPVNFESNSE